MHTHTLSLAPQISGWRKDKIKERAAVFLVICSASGRIRAIIDLNFMTAPSRPEADWQRVLALELTTNLFPSLAHSQYWTNANYAPCLRWSLFFIYFREERDVLPMKFALRLDLFSSSASFNQPERKREMSGTSLSTRLSPIRTTQKSFKILHWLWDILLFYCLIIQIQNLNIRQICKFYAGNFLYLWDFGTDINIKIYFAIIHQPKSVC